MDYTSIEQSKKLLELGLNPETADMKWYYWKDEIDAPKVPTLGFDKAVLESYKNIQAVYLPCWSLGALLEVMPPYLFEFERGIDLNIYRNLNGKGWHVSYIPNNDESMQKDKFRQITNGGTPIEAAYNMVVWLIENGYIKKGE